MRGGRFSLLGAGAVALLLLGGCDTVGEWIGESEDPPLPGQRVSVLRLEQTLEPDPGISDLAVKLPPPWRNAVWPQADGFSNHAMHHLELGGELKTVWQRDAGEGSSGSTRLLSRPLVAEGRVYVFDAESNVAAFDASDGKPLWRIDLTPEEEDSGALGGGIAWDDGRIFAATGYGEVVALDAASGEVVWHQRLGTPFRVAPAAADGRVFAIGVDNRTHALAAADGRPLWEHSGIVEEAGLIGGAAPAVDGPIVVSAYSSGELFALRVENGRPVWQDQLVRIARFTPLAVLSEIRGAPVIDRGLVIAVSHSGRMVAVDLRTGTRVWEIDVEGVETPWVAGDFIFTVSTQGELLCISRRDGRIRWVTQLQRFEQEDGGGDPVQWAGPVLAGDRLVLVSSHGRAVAISPYTGKLIGRLPLSGAALLAPVVADATLYILTDDANLAALR